MDSGASHHIMSKRDLTPEEQETIQQSKDPSVIVTANGTTHTTEEAMISVSELDIFVQGYAHESPNLHPPGALNLVHSGIYQ